MTVLCRDKELPPYENGNRSGAIAPIIPESSDLINYKEKGEIFSGTDFGASWQISEI